MREIDAVTAPLVPFLYPVRGLGSGERRGMGRYAPGAKPTRIPEER